MHPLSYKMKHLILLFLLSFSSLGQINVLDSKSNIPIHNVEVYNRNGILIGVTNSFGDISNVNENDLPLLLSHFLYENLELKKLNHTVKLSPKSILLNDVIVNAKSLKYLIIEGYYRGFQTRNDTLDIYSDSKLNWIINSRNYKSVGYELISSRYFLSKKYNYYKQGRIFFGMKLNTLPQFQVDINKFKKNKRSNNIYEWIFENNDGLPVEVKLLGNTSNILINKDELFTSTIDTPLENILFFNHKHKLTFKPKKIKETYSYESIDEFIPIKVYFSDELPKNIQKSVVLNRSLNSEIKFWEEFEKMPNFKKLSPILEKSLSSSMEMIK